MTEFAEYEPYDIRGQVALVSGASAGIGEATAIRLAHAGANLVLLARRQDRLERLAGELRERYGVKVHIEGLDVREVDAITSLPDRLPAGFREVDILVNNAGLALGTSAVQDNNLADAATMLSTNVLGVLAFMRAFVPGMIERGRGHIINLSSIAGHEGYQGGSVYCGTKHAVEGITEAARHDLIATPVRVSAISPGAVNTEFSLVRYKGDQASADKVYEGFHPLVAADIADQIVYVATRPPHVQIVQLLCLATNQAAATKKAAVLLKD